MTIDVATRFPRTTLRDAYDRSQRSEAWVFDQVICSSVTMIYGRSNVGKSYLAGSLILSLIVEDREFLGMQPSDPTKLWKPAILWTDPGSDEEYGKRIYSELPEGEEVDVPMYHVGRTARPDKWEKLTDHLISEGYNFVVVDNLMGITGDTNDFTAVTTVFDGLTRLTSRGIPVVILHHESEHGMVTPGAAPMGASNSVQKSRAWIQVRQTAKRKLRGGNTALVIQSNALDQPLQIVAEPMTGPNYKVLNRGPWVPKDDNDEKPKQKRKSETYDKNATKADFVVRECQGLGLNAAARQMAVEFGGSDNSHKSSLSTGALSKMLSRSGKDTSTQWSRTVPTPAG